MALSVESVIDAVRPLLAACEFERSIPLLEDLNARGEDTPLSNELLGYAHTQLRHYRLAEFHYSRAVNVEGPALSAIIGLSDVYAYQFKTDDASALLERIPLESLSPPQRGLVLAARGNVASLAFRLEDAIQSYLQAVSYLPDMWTSWLSLAIIYCEAGRFDLATGCFEKAQVLSNNFWTAFHLAVHYHLLGRHREGYELSEKRLREPKLHHKELDLPTWDGKPCDTLVVFTEGGFGDIVLHSRYLKYAAGICRKVIFVTWPKIIPLMEKANLPKNVELTTKPETDYTMKRASLMSLPLYLNLVEPEDASIPTYFTTQDAAPLPKNRVAITWFGDHKFPHTIARDATLEEFEPMIRAHPEIEWVTFSPEERAKEDITRLKLDDLVTQITLPVEEMIEEMKRCDLLISVDTAHVHVAGSLGVPVWMLVYKLPGVYWGLDTRSTPYYQSVRLFRQRVARSWAEPLEDIRHAIEARFGSGNGFEQHPGISQRSNV